MRPSTYLPLTTAALCAACSIPLDVYRLQEGEIPPATTTDAPPPPAFHVSEPAAGIRYTLRRPGSYKTHLTVGPHELNMLGERPIFNVFVTSRALKIKNAKVRGFRRNSRGITAVVPGSAGKVLEEKELPGGRRRLTIVADRDAYIAGDTIVIGAIPPLTQLRVEESRLTFKRADLKVHVEQELDGEPYVFEARPSASPLSSLNVSLTILEEGTLSELSAGATDKTLEAIKAAATIAVTAAGAAEVAGTTYVNLPESLDRFVSRVVRLRRAKDEAIEHLQNRLIAAPIVLDTQKALEARVTAIGEQLTAARFQLKPAWCRVEIDSVRVFGDTAASPKPWFVLKLASQ